MKDSILGFKLKLVSIKYAHTRFNDLKKEVDPFLKTSAGSVQTYITFYTGKPYKNCQLGLL